MGDSNLNLPKYMKTLDFNHLLDILLSTNFIPQITLPTRVSKTIATLTNNIFMNNFEHKCLSANIATSVFDHLPQFTIIENAKDIPLNKTNYTVTFHYFRHINKYIFKAGIKK